MSSTEAMGARAALPEAPQSHPVLSGDAEDSNLNSRIEYLEQSIAAAGGAWSASPKRFWVVVTNSEGASIGKSGFGKFSL